MRAEVSELLGRVLASVGVNEERDEIAFVTNDGVRYEMLHDQECCENVSIESVAGDLGDLVGSPLTMAEESSNSDDPPLEGYDDCYTWTFYRFATVKGYVTIRWFGSSNGYYGTGVSFYRMGK